MKKEESSSKFLFCTDSITLLMGKGFPHCSAVHKYSHSLIKEESKEGQVEIGLNQPFVTQYL